MKAVECCVIPTAVILILQAKYNLSLAVAKNFPFRYDYENETFIFNEMSNNYSSHNLLPRRIRGTSRGGESIGREKLGKCHKSNRIVENFRFRDAMSIESKTKFKNSLPSDTSSTALPNAFGYDTFKPREINQNFASPDKTEFQFLRSSLARETLNALHKSLLVHPFKTWKLKHKFSSMEDIRIHEDKLHAVIDNARSKRLREKLNKVLQGEDVFLDVFGGSNTLGGGLRKEEGNTEGIYPEVIEHWWGKVITPITGSKLKLRAITMGATSNEFFQFCFGSYIHQILDIVLIEMAVNDVRELPSNANKSIPLEQLTRQLLVYPSEPALIYVNVFDGHTCKEGCTNLEDYGLGILSDIYNITSLRLRDAVNCPKKPDNNPSMVEACDVITSSDHFHINQLGHAHISLMIINVFRKILLDHTSSLMKNSRVLVFHEIKSTRGLFSHNIPSFSGKIAGDPEAFPSQALSSQDENQFSRKTFRRKIKLPPPAFIKNPSNVITKPLCWTTVRPSHFLNEVKINLDVFVTKSEGFYMVDTYSSWTGRTLGANTAFLFTIPAGISPGGFKTRSVAVAVQVCVPCGEADMWLDNEYKKKTRVQTKFIYTRKTVMIVALQVEPGEHTLNIEIVKEGYVNIIGLMIGPPDGPY